MKIAIGISESKHVYHQNPCTAPSFAVYNIYKEDLDIFFSLDAIFDNPASKKSIYPFSKEEIDCDCSEEKQKDFFHACEHYVLLDVLGGSSYLLADKYCPNTLQSLHNGGVTIYKIPAIIREVDNAIKNFLIGANFANTVQNIYYAP